MNIKTLIGNIRKAFSQSSLGSFTTHTSTGVRHRSQEDLLKEYQNMVYVCVNLIADEVSAYRPMLYRGEDARRVRVPKHPLLDLVAKPNPYMTQSEFFEAYQIYMELVGEAFIYASRGEQTGKPKQLYLIRPDKMKVVVDDQGEVTGYALRKSNGTEVPFEVNEIIHVKDFNPLNPYRGLSAVEAAILYIDTETATSEFQNTFLRNQATPSGVFALKGNMTPEAFKKIKEEWKENYGGQHNAGKTLVIRADDASFTKLGLSIADINLEGITNLNEDKILKIFRVPEAMLGVTDSSGLGRANIEAIEYIFAKRTIEPKLGKLDDAMQSALGKWYPGESAGIVVDHESSVPEDKEFKLKTISAGVDKWMTRNEVRNELGAGDKVNGGDFLYINSTVFAPIDNPGRVAGNLEGDSSVTPVVEPAKSLGKIVIREHVHEHVEKDTEDATTPEQALFQALERIEQAADKKYKPALNKLLKAQEALVLARITSKKKQEPAATENEYEYEFNDEELESVVAILIATLLRSGDVGIKFVDVDDITEFVLQQSTRDAIFESTKRLLKSFNEETALKIQKAIAAGLAEGEDVAALSKRIEAIYKDAKGYRATRIANTEAHKAVNQGVAEAYSQAGYRRMKWVANPGACKYCKTMDGTIKEIGTPFVPVGASVNGADGSEYLNNYVDVAYADLHPGCRCYLIPVL